MLNVKKISSEPITNMVSGTVLNKKYVTNTISEVAMALKSIAPEFSNEVKKNGEYTVFLQPEFVEDTGDLMNLRFGLLSIPRNTIDVIEVTHNDVNQLVDFIYAQKGIRGYTEVAPQSKVFEQRAIPCPQPRGIGMQNGAVNNVELFDGMIRYFVFKEGADGFKYKTVNNPIESPKKNNISTIEEMFDRYCKTLTRDELLSSLKKFYELIMNFDLAVTCFKDKGKQLGDGRINVGALRVLMAHLYKFDNTILSMYRYFGKTVNDTDMEDYYRLSELCESYDTSYKQVATIDVNKYPQYLRRYQRVQNELNNVCSMLQSLEQTFGV